MTKAAAATQRRKSIFFAIVAAGILFAVCLSFIFILQDSLKHRESLETTQRYMTFESKVERLVYSNIILLKGFEAYLKVNPDLEEKVAHEYLEYLLEGNFEYIRSIGVVEDTTILWNYPRNTNSKAIGVDLATVESQRDIVLRVKETGKPVIHGPINLVQGDTGFSVRHPIMRGNKYWGQTSIVLKTEQIFDTIRAYAESEELNVAIYSQENESEPFFDSMGQYDKYLVFEMDPSFINWRIHVGLSYDWYDNPLLISLMVMFSSVISIGMGVMVCKYLKNNYAILNMSTHDHLTGLFNRHFLSEYQKIVIDSAKRQERKAALLMIDLNGFKKINDTYGHQVGDKALVEAARLLKQCTRADETIFRLGGDEFLIIIPEISSEEQISVIRERLTECFKHKFHIQGYPIKICFSLGYALFPEDGQDFDSLMRKADNRLYKDKETRKQSAKTGQTKL